MADERECPKCGAALPPDAVPLMTHGGTPSAPESGHVTCPSCGESIPLVRVGDHWIVDQTRPRE